RLRLLLGSLAADRVQVFVHGARELCGMLPPVDARLARAVDDLVVDVGDVAHVRDAQPAMTQVAVHHVEHHQHAGITHVEVVVDGDTAAVHAYVTGFDGPQFLLLARQGIVDADHAAKRFRRSWMVVRSMDDNSGASSGPSGEPVSASRSGFHSACPFAPVADLTASTMASSEPPAAAAAAATRKNCVPASRTRASDPSSSRGDGPNTTSRQCATSAGSSTFGRIAAMNARRRCASMSRGVSAASQRSLSSSGM